jgi:hypothetical protein
MRSANPFDSARLVADVKASHPVEFMCPDGVRRTFEGGVHPPRGDAITWWNVPAQIDLAPVSRARVRWPSSLWHLLGRRSPDQGRERSRVCPNGYGPTPA